MTEPGKDADEMVSPSVVILGATGMLGHKLFQKLLPGFPGTVCVVKECVSEAPYSNIPLFQSGKVIGGIDAFDFNELSRVLRRLRPQVLINCIGMIKQRNEASSYISTITLNSLLPHRLAELSANWGGRLIHFSTDCVFSGRQGMYTEDDRSDAEDLYGKTKFLGETTEANALTLRTSIIGRELTNHRSLLDWFLSNKGGQVNGYCKSIYSGVTTNYLAEVVAEIIAHHPQLSGVYQVASDPISKYDLLCLLRKVYDLDVRIEPVDGENVDRSMDSSKFRDAVGYKCPSWSLLAEQLANDPTPYEQWLQSGH
jgi:dTDP-4-dehydrorhamnose reductase